MNGSGFLEMLRPVLTPSIKSLCGMVAELIVSFKAKRERLAYGGATYAILHDERQIPHVPNGLQIVWLYGSWRAKGSGFSAATYLNDSEKGRIVAEALWISIFLVVVPARFHSIIVRGFWFETIRKLIIESGISHVCLIAHFNDYVPAFSQLRAIGVVKSLVGIQHGAFERTVNGMNCRFDRYTIIDEVWRSAAVRHFGKDAKIVIAPSSSAREWRVRSIDSSLFIALALQDDDFNSDYAIYKKLHQFASERGWHLVVYPHPRTSPNRLRSIFGSVKFEYDNRWCNSLALVTRYSTVGVEYLKFGITIFVDCGIVLDMNYEGNAICCKIEDLVDQLEQRIEIE